MSYSVRPMRREDTAQVSEVDREAFPTLWPLINYQREMENPLARYIVVCDEGKTVQQPMPEAVPKNGLWAAISRVRQLLNLSRLFGNELPPSGRQYIIGFVGFWIVLDEAHITNIAVRESYRRRGVGELLLISAIDLAGKLNANIVTLEVRVSNTVAQALYSKYGFTQVGLRRGYYLDNREDAVLMSTEKINSASFQSHHQQLKQAYSKKLGTAVYNIV